MLYRGDGRPERGPWDAWTVLAALAAATTRVRLGPLVAATAFHSPGLMARMAAAMDEISGGRFTLGLGTGWNEVEFHAFGIPFDHRVARFEEAFAIVRRLLAGERVTAHGRYYEVEDAVLLPAPARRVPIMVGTTGPRVMAAAGPHVDWWNCWYSWYGNSPEGFAELSARFEGGFSRSACVLVQVDGGRASGRSRRTHRRSTCATCARTWTRSPTPAPTRRSWCSTRSTRKPSPRSRRGSATSSRRPPSRARGCRSSHRPPGRRRSPRARPSAGASSSRRSRRRG